MSNFTTMDDLGDVSSAWAAVDGMSFQENVEMQMHNFRGHMVEAFLTYFKTVVQRTDAVTANLQMAATLGRGFAKAIKHKDLQSNRCECLLAAMEAAVDLKTAMNELRMEIDDGGGKAETLTTYFVAKRKLDEMIEKGKLTEAKGVLQQLAGNIDVAVAKMKAQIDESCTATLRLLLEEVGKKKGRLDRVAGGTDDSKSWKAGVPEDATLQCSSMQDAIKVVQEAFCSAIETRSRELNEAWGFMMPASMPRIWNGLQHYRFVF
jgi:hypothetical protein